MNSLPSHMSAPSGQEQLRERGSYRPGAPQPGFEPARTALLVIDPVNDFLSEGGAAWEMIKGTVHAHDVICHLRQAIEAARRHRIPVGDRRARPAPAGR